MKKRALFYSDGPTAATGFGTVARNVAAALYGTGEWDITFRAINFYGQRHDFPYSILPAGYPDGDPFGKKNFLRDLSSHPPFDLIWMCNDTYVVNDLAGDLLKLLQSGYPARLIYYFPVDCKIPPHMTDMIRAASLAVAYSRFGEAETKKVAPDVKLAVIPHGCDDVPRLSAEDRKKLRQQAFNITDDETFLWMTCNRNSVRKDIARTIQAFAAFHDYQPNSLLYAHCQPQDNGLDMQAAAADAGIGDCVAFPGDFSLSSGGMPRDMLMRCYQLADGFIATHLGEGWGLSVSEAMACGLPIVAPNNTTMPEMLGADYPYLYPCTETVWVDNSGYRPRGTVRDVFAAMKRLYEQRGTDAAKAALARNDNFVKTVSWSAVGEMWIKLIDYVMSQPATAPVPIVEAV